MVHVGVVGLGRIGLPVARNLMTRGFMVTGYRRSGCDELAAAGGQPAACPAEVAARSDVLLSILPDVDALAEVVLGPAGTLTAILPGTVHIEMSSIDAKHKARIRDAVRAAGGDLLDCPISGTPAMVADRQAITFASGDPASVDTVRSVLDAISGRWMYAGAFGAGTALKYVANLLFAVYTVTAAEALTLATRLDLDPQLMEQILNPPSAGSAMWKGRGRAVRSQRWPQLQGPIEALHSSLEQIVDAAKAAGVDLPVFAVAKEVFDKAMADGHGQLDVAAVRDRIAVALPSDDETMAVEVSSETG